ncbi:response regulator transcription factor [Vagococcus sp.]|uniref:response regulator transcription factor n=1 Tax=Vagococcus sp. TaxID=1933889 RepID=UPI003F96EBD5
MYKLLIVEDEQLERRALRTIITKNLSDQIILCEDATSGIEAVQIARNRKPDIILMDIGLPELNGLEAQSQIIEFLPDVYTVVITAYSDYHYMQKAVQEQTIDYLLKPVRPINLIESIQKIIVKIEHTKNTTTPAKRSQFNTSDTPICKALTYIEQNFNEDLTLNDIANYVHLSPQYFSRYFKKKMKISYIDYLNQLRIQSAKALLKETNLPIYRIASDLGFADANYFSRVFVKYEGDTPTVYRKIYQ